jgi:hypothetical protein
MVSYNLALAIPTLVAVASAAKNTGPFPLFAYGPGIGGLPLFSTGGMFDLKQVIKTQG